MAEGVAAGFSALPIARQVGLLLGLAASIATGLWVFNWAKEPSYTALYTSLEARDTSEVVAALQGAAIPYKLDTASGVVMVEPGRVHEARLKMAAQGLPKGTGIGVEILREEQSFGTSQFVESKRYHHAIETELARTIGTMQNVKSARVHLAIPKRSVFVRDRTPPSASVALNLYGGRTIEQGQVSAIIHMVASSVSHLSASQVTVVDQTGRLLSSGDESNEVAMTGKQYDYTKKIETDYANRIERLLEPIVGFGKVRANVNAVIDFTQEESTEEIFNPERTSVRSEQSSESARFDGQTAAGVPGALSNQPPAAGNFAQGAGEVGGAEGATARPLNSNKNTVRNYELDRTIRHKRSGTGVVQRLTVAVLVDDHVVAKGNKQERTPLTDDEMNRITTLVQQTIGFNEERGDKVNVINASFTPTEEVEDLPEPGLMENPLIQNIGKQVLTGIIILVLVFVVLRPTIKNLANYSPPAPVLPPAEIAAREEQARLEQKNALPMPSESDQKVEFAKSMVQQDPRKVANVVKDWISNES